jgi:hypothetical protein
MTWKELHVTEGAMYRYIERADEVRGDVLAAFLRNPKGKQPWQRFPAARFLKLWADAAREGFVRDEKGLDELVDIMITNTAKLTFNTEMCGHTERDPVNVVDDLNDRIRWTDLRNERYGDWCEDERGMWRLSDSATPKLENYAAALLDAETATAKMQIIDLMLQVVHPRGDMAGLFVEGGSLTLSMR